MSKRSREQRKKQQQKNDIKERENQKDVEESIQAKETNDESKISENKNITNENKSSEPVKEGTSSSKVENNSVQFKTQNEAYETLPNESISKFSKILSIFLTSSIAILGVLILIVGVLFATQVYKSKDKNVYEYADNIENAISDGNRNYFSYFISNKGSNTYITSPIAVQKSLCDINLEDNTEDSNIFKAFNNGYNSWGTSSDLLDSDYIHTISIGANKDIDNTNLTEEDLAIELKRRIKNLTNNYIDDADLTDYTKDCKIVSILGLDVKLLNSWYNSETNLVYYNGNLEINSGDNYTCLKLSMKNDYNLYLIKSDDYIITSDILKENFKKKDGIVALNPYVYQSKGKTTNIVYNTSLCNSLEQHPDYNNIVSVLKFGINCNDLPVKSDTEKDYNFDFYDEFLNDYSFVIENDKGQFILLGYVNE